MKLHTTYLEGAVLPTVVAAALVMLTATLGLLALWEQETLLFTRTQRLRQARADVESAALLYRLHPDERALTAAGGYLLYDSLPQSRIFVRREPWGLYELLHITTADSLVASSRIVGAEPDPARTLFYADDRTAVTLAGDTRLHGTLRLPQNGLTYGRVGAEFYRGEEVPRTAIRSSAAMLPAPSAAVAARIGALFAFAQQLPAAGDLPDSLGISFRDPTVALRLGTAEIGGCTLRGRIVLAADELRIDSACRLENVLVCARKVTVGSGARIAAQLFARHIQKLGRGPVAGQHCGGYNEVTGNAARIPLPNFHIDFMVPFTATIVDLNDDPFDYPKVDIPIEHPFEEWLRRENNSLDRLLDIIRKDNKTAGEEIRELS